MPLPPASVSETLISPSELNIYLAISIAEIAGVAPKKNGVEQASCLFGGEVSVSPTLAERGAQASVHACARGFQFSTEPEAPQQSEQLITAPR